MSDGNLAPARGLLGPKWSLPPQLRLLGGSSPHWPRWWPYLSSTDRTWSCPPSRCLQHLPASVLHLNVSPPFPWLFSLSTGRSKVVSMELPFPSNHTKPKRQIHFRKLENIDADALDLQLLSAGCTDFLSVAHSFLQSVPEQSSGPPCPLNI